MQPTLLFDVAPDTHDTPLLVLPVFGSGTEVEFAGGAEWIPAAARADARPTAGASVLTHPEAEGPTRVAMIGVGASSSGVDAEKLRRFAGAAVRLAEGRRLTEVTIHLPETAMEPGAAHRAIAEGLVLAAWSFRELKSGHGEESSPVRVRSATILGYGDPEVAEEAVRIGTIVAEAENAARTFQMRPGNVATPTHLAEEARRIAHETGMSVRILGPDEMREERMGALLAVAQGSAQEPRMMVLRHDGGTPGEKPLVLVGKGLTFDAGGISIKPAKGMEEMKFDMSGGAAVLGAMQGIARLGLPRNVIGVVPSSENLVGAAAMKPGDVVTTRSGITVEVINTDAEGRLILCDALDYAVTELKPEAIVDCATLTGAVVIGLGHQAIGVMGTSQAVVDEVLAAGEGSGERGWQLPLWDAYRKQLDSPAADLQNVGGRPAGTITAGLFLRQFVKEVPWAHLDIAGTAYGDGNDVSYRRKGGYGVPTRLLIEWVRSRAG